MKKLLLWLGLVSVTDLLKEASKYCAEQEQISVNYLNKTTKEDAIKTVELNFYDGVEHGNRSIGVGEFINKYISK